MGKAFTSRLLTVRSKPSTTAVAVPTQIRTNIEQSDSVQVKLNIIFNSTDLPTVALSKANIFVIGTI
jgi:hypothetical protein